MRAYERFIRYAKVYTTSDPESSGTPSTARQFDLARMLVDEMHQLGILDASVDEHGFVLGSLPASSGYESVPPLGFLAHMDTAPDASGENVQPQIWENYDGGAVTLPSGAVLTPDMFPSLRSLKGMTLITSDGNTLLGADDKAGIAEILTACEQIQAKGTPHGKICIAFTPDEEIGTGVELFPLERFGAVCAYTVDGGPEGEIAYETFNACKAEISIQGLSVHPGSAKDTMINAALLAMEFNRLLPEGDVPRCTEGYEGFFHLCSVSGNVEEAHLSYIVRDHDRNIFEARKKMLLHAAHVLNERYGREAVSVQLEDQYFNMAEKLADHMSLIDNARIAAERAGMHPYMEAVRGGTDGARLSFMGMPTPNLCTGGYAFHGPFEHIAVESMDRCARMVELLMTELR